MDEFYMNEALIEAKKAYDCGEVPIGAVIVDNNGIVSRAHNTKDSSKCAIFHAEVNAIIEATKQKKNWRLSDCVMYVTLLPCPMCASAISQSRIKMVVYGANNDNVDKGLIYSIFNAKNSNIVEITGGILENTCGKLLKDFFSEKR